VKQGVKYVIRVDIISVTNMLIKTTKDDADQHFFIGLNDVDDKRIDHDITIIYYRIWAINTANQMLKDFDPKGMVIAK